MFKIFFVLSLIYTVYSLETPIIGILSQETYIVQNDLPEPHNAFIAASYVKYLESAGARVVPVWIGQDEEYYRRVVKYTNGVLFPGGGTYFDEVGGYGEAAKEIYKLTLEANDAGVYYPLWGTCLGLQVLGFVAVGEDIRIDCSLRNKAIPLDFVEGFQGSRLFSGAPQHIISSLRADNVTFNNHRYCLTEEVLEQNGILAEWRILSTNRDDSGIEFISAMESIKYPIYGVQFHPEKNQFEFKNRGIPHNGDAVRVSQYFADFFVDESRRNNNSFPQDIEKKSLIYNYQPAYTGLTNGSYEQIYVFDREDFNNAPLISNLIV